MIAKKIKNSALNTADAVYRATYEPGVVIDQDWDNETTTYKFPDGSALVVSGPEIWVAGVTRGGKRQGARRKPGPTKDVRRSIIKQVRWTPAEWAAVSQAAKNINETPSEFQRKATLERAREERNT